MVISMKNLQVALYEKLHQRPAGVDKLNRLWEAAVIVPLVETEEGVSLLFEVRSSKLNSQPGEICFPGGKYECVDKKFSTTAVRETCEELGLEESDVELCGPLDCVVTHAGPIIYPYVGILRQPQKISYNRDEVAKVFTVPLKALLEQEPRTCYMQMADRPREDFPFELVPYKKKDWRFHKDYILYFYQYQNYVIWGMTGRILYAFLRRNRTILQEFAK